MFRTIELFNSRPLHVPSKPKYHIWLFSLLLDLPFVYHFFILEDVTRTHARTHAHTPPLYFSPQVYLKIPSMAQNWSTRWLCGNDFMSLQCYRGVSWFGGVTSYNMKISVHVSIIMLIDTSNTPLLLRNKNPTVNTGHSSDDASTSSGPAIHMASIEGNKRATNKVESWLRKAAQKKVSKLSFSIPVFLS